MAAADGDRGLRLRGSHDSRQWFRIAAVAGRPPTRQQLEAPEPVSEVLLFEPVTLQALRVVRRAGPRRWSVAELLLTGCDASG